MNHVTGSSGHPRSVPAIRRHHAVASRAEPAADALADAARGADDDASGDAADALSGSPDPVEDAPGPVAAAPDDPAAPEGGSPPGERDAPADRHAARPAARPAARAADAAPEPPSPTPDGAAPAAAARPAPALKPLAIEVPEAIGRYRIGKRIGSGTCGVVHRARDQVLGRDVAIKLSPIGEAHVSTGKVPGAQRAYQTEIVAAGRLTHPNIVTVHDAGQHRALNYLVMEIVAGRSLKEYGKGREPLPTHRALAVIADCCLALDYSHGRDILHRDIKPANIMLTDAGEVKLLDFGIAVGLSGAAGLTRQGPTLGTPNYMSPEQILGRELGPASDFYSLATVLFELLTGRQLFKAKKVKELFRTVVQQTAPRLVDVRPDLPPELSEVLSRALQKKPALRFQSGEEMREALLPFVERFRTAEERSPEQQRFIRRLQRQSFFLSFSDVEIAQLLELVRVRRFRPGEVLLRAGDVERRLLIVTDGLVRVSGNGDLLALRGEGDCVGELGFINGAPENRESVALTAGEALDVTSEALAELPPRVHLHYYRFISEILADRLARDGRLQLDHAL